MRQSFLALALALLGCSSAVGDGEVVEQGDLDREHDPRTHTQPATAGCEHRFEQVDDRDAQHDHAAAIVSNVSAEAATVKLTRGGALIDVTVVGPGASQPLGLPGHLREADANEAGGAERLGYRVSSDQPIRVYRHRHDDLDEEEEPMEPQAFVKLGVTLLPLVLAQPFSTGCAAPIEPGASPSTDDEDPGAASAGSGGGSSASTGGVQATSSSSGSHASAATGASTSASAGAGGSDAGAACDSPDPAQCVACQQCAAATQCKPEYDACIAASDCMALSNCLTGCNGDAVCEDGCVEQHGSGAPLLEAAASCLYCSACVASCDLCA